MKTIFKGDILSLLPQSILLSWLYKPLLEHTFYSVVQTFRCVRTCANMPKMLEHFLNMFFLVQNICISKSRRQTFTTNPSSAVPYEWKLGLKQGRVRVFI